MNIRADVVVVGAGPAGSAAAAWAARSGRDVLVIDSAQFPRDKACGDGLTPRAIAEMQQLGLGPWLDGRIAHHGLRMSLLVRGRERDTLSERRQLLAGRRLRED